jgi:membrane associated rhomboid family serine protease
MGAFLVTFPSDEIRSILVIFVFVRISYIPAILLIGSSGVAYLAHVGGFIFGAVFARLLGAPPASTLK